MIMKDSVGNMALPTVFDIIARCGNALRYFNSLSQVTIELMPSMVNAKHES